MKTPESNERPTLDEVLFASERHLITPLAPRSKTPRKPKKRPEGVSDGGIVKNAQRIAAADQALRPDRG